MSDIKKNQITDSEVTFCYQMNPPDWTIPGYSLDYALGILWELPEYTPQAQTIPHHIQGGV